jgi:hypothetical protein
MIVRQRDMEHGSWQHGGDGSLDFNGFVLAHREVRETERA